MVLARVSGIDEKTYGAVAACTVDVPAELAEALDGAGLRAAFDALSFTLRKEAARSVADAKQEATRHRRIEKVLDTLR
ncbi:YdeI/OmpD-associated family protein [Microbacterium stercoris]|nr:YdeI/OmpD-associated family protein [Microbacterium stercoris]